MRLKIYVLTVVCVALCSFSLSAQDLGQLPVRATQFWELRAQSNRLGALEFVDPETRQIFTQGTESPILSFKVSGLEFSDKPDRVDVLVKVHSLIPKVGEIDRVVHETWVWKEGRWFMRAAAAPKLFSVDDDKPVTAAPVPPKFVLTSGAIDVGRHAQGERLEGKIQFQANRGEIVVIRPVQTVTGLAIGSPMWTSATEGYLPYQWETLLLPPEVNQTLTLEAIATSDAHVSANLQVRARIDAKVGFKQVPEIVDPTKAGQVELYVQNLTAKPLKILGVTSPNRAFVVDDDITTLIEAGKSGRLLIRYPAQSEAVGASIGLVLSETIAGSDLVTVPLNIKTSEAQRPGYTREQLDQIIKATPKLP